MCKSRCPVVLNNATIFVAQFKQYFIFALQSNFYNLAIITTIPVYLNVGLFCNLLSIQINCIDVKIILSHFIYCLQIII